MTTRDIILSSLEPVVAQAKFVAINDAKVVEVAARLKDAAIPSWDNSLQLLGTPAETAHYYFFLDSINFCFWAPKGQTRWEYLIESDWVGGYYAYARAIKDAFLRDKRFFDAAYLRDISYEDFAAIFTPGRNTLLLVPERWAIIKENFGILADHFDGQVLALLAAARYDADELVALVRATFPTFEDVAEVDGGKAVFLKRAQILTSDLAFTGLPELAVENLDHLAAFADYKLPQLLQYLGALTYAPTLLEQMAGEQLIPKGSQEEVEMRACSVVAIERIRAELERLGGTMNANELDWLLWVEAKATKFPLPHHKTLTTFY